MVMQEWEVKAFHGAQRKNDRLDALREVRDWADGQQYGYGEGYNEGFDSALGMVVRHIDALIEREEEEG